MPYIEDEALNNLHAQIDKLENEKLKLENELKEVEEDYKKHKKESKFLTIPLILLFLGSAIAAIYFYKNGSGNVDIASIKKEENRRILDSLSIAKTLIELDDSDDSNENNNSLANDDNTAEEKVTNSKKATPSKPVAKPRKIAVPKMSGNKFYAVQVAAFTDRRTPLMSSNMLTNRVTKEDEYYKYSLGMFSTLNEARKFRKELVRIGFNDAFVASYVNGKRQRIENP